MNIKFFLTCIILSLQASMHCMEVKVSFDINDQKTGLIETKTETLSRKAAEQSNTLKCMLEFSDSQDATMSSAMPLDARHYPSFLRLKGFLEELAKNSQTTQSSATRTNAAATIHFNVYSDEQLLHALPTVDFLEIGALKPALIKKLYDKFLTPTNIDAAFENSEFIVQLEEVGINTYLRHALASQFDLRYMQKQEIFDHQGAVTDVVLSPDGTVLVSCSSGQIAIVYKRNQETHKFEKKQILNDHKERVQGAAVTPDGNLIVTCSDDKNTFVYQKDQLTGQYKKIQQLTGHETWVMGVAVTHDGNTIVTCSADKTVLVYQKDQNAHQYAKIQTLSAQHIRTICAVAISASGETLVSSSYDQTVIVYKKDKLTGQYAKAQQFSDHGDNVKAVAITADGSTITSTGNDCCVVVYQKDQITDNYIKIEKFDSHKYWVRGIALSSCGKLIASCSQDRSMIVFGRENKAEKFSQIQQLFGHKNYLTSIALTGDGKTIATGSEDHTVLIYDKIDRSKLLLEHVILYMKALALQKQNQMLNLKTVKPHIIDWWHTMPEDLKSNLINNDMVINAGM